VKAKPYLKRFEYDRQKLKQKQTNRKALWSDVGKYLIDVSKILLVAAVIAPIFQKGEMPPIWTYGAVLLVFALGLYFNKKGV
jgi:hypothetical protein